MRHKVFSSVLLASMAIWSVDAELVQIANKPYYDGLGGESSGAYRIPAMAKSTNGVIVAVYDCRYNSSGDLPNVIDLAENWSGDNGATWSKPRVAVDVPNTNNYQKVCNIGDPCIVYDPDGDKFWLMGITGGGLVSSHDSSGNSISDVVLYTRGTGENDTWQEWTGGPEGNGRSVKQMILDSLAEVDPNATNDEDRICGILQGPGHGVVQRQTVFAPDGETVLMPKDAIVFPMQYFSTKRSENTSSWAAYSWAFAVYSTDGGVTWKSTKLAPTQKAQESCVMELDDGSWVMMAKCQSGGERYFFRTTDYLNWTKYDSLSPSAACQGSCLWLGKGADGKSRYVSCFAENGDRSNITLHYGFDSSNDKNTLGITWRRNKDEIIAKNDGAWKIASYNSLVMLDEYTLGILLEVGGSITFKTMDVSEILESDFTEVVSPTPAAVWDGDFSQDNASQNGWWIENWNDAHAADWSSVTLDRDNQGLMINSESGKSGMTVLVKYSGLSNSASAHRVLAASCVTAAHKYDRTGITLKSDGKLVGFWNSSTSASSDTDNGTASGSIASSGVMAFTYGIGGTYLYYGSDTASISSTAAWGDSGLKSSYDSNNSSIYGAAIGGMCAEASRGGYEAAKGMTISGIAVFDRVLSAEEMNAYKWPIIQVMDIDTDTSVSAINANIDASANLIRLNVAPGVVIDVDQAFSNAVPATVRSNGSITLSAESQPDASWFANVDFSGVQGALLRSWLTPGVVGFNFYKNKGNDTTGALATGTWWYNASSKAGTSTELFSDGLSVLSWNCSAVYSQGGYYDSTGVEGSLLNGYLDDGSLNGNGVEVKLSGVPYTIYDVIIYCASDTNPADFKAKTVNGKTYTWDSSTGSVVEGSANWGKAALGIPVYGVNAMRIKNLSGPLAIYGGARSGSNRGGIAAFQIMPPETPDNIRTYKLALDGTATTWSGGTWTLDGESADAPTSGFVEIEATASTALTVDQAVNLADLKVRGGTDIVVNVSTNGAGSLYALKATVESGVLQQGSPAVLGATPTVVVKDGATFDLNGKAVDMANIFAIAGAGAGDWPWAVTSSSPGDARLPSAPALSADASIGGANKIILGKSGSATAFPLGGRTLAKTGAGELYCYNVRTDDGTLDIAGGTVSFNQWTALDGYETIDRRTTAIVRDGATLANKAGRRLWIDTLDVRGGTVYTASGAPFGVSSAFGGSCTTAKLQFNSGAIATLDGDLTLTETVLDGDVSFLRASTAQNDVVVASASLTAESGTITVGDGVVLDLGANRPGAMLSFAAGAGLAVRLAEGENAVSLAADSLPSTFVLYGADGLRIAKAKATLADGFLAIAAARTASESISINFNDGNALSSEGGWNLGLDGYGVARDSWNNLIATNNASLAGLKCLQANGDELNRRSMRATVTGTRGYWSCSNLASGSDILHGYIDDDDSHAAPTVTVSGIPYDKYRVAVYHSTDTANARFGYDLVNGIPFTGFGGHTSAGTESWGDSGPHYSAKALEEGVNVLVTPILPNNAEKTLTVSGHRVSGGIRGCIAAIQIFDASEEEREFDNATNRVSSTYAGGAWLFPDDIVVADPDGFGGMIIGTNAVRQSLGSSTASMLSASVLASIPESGSGALVSFGVTDNHAVHAIYNGNGTFTLTYDATGGGAQVATPAIDVSGVHVWTLTYKNDAGASLYKDGMLVKTAGSVKWSGTKVAGSVEFGARHDGSDPLTGAIIYAARTDFGNSVAKNADHVISKAYSDDECPGMSRLEPLAWKSELFTHLAAYGDTEGLLALMPHRTSTYEYGGWHCPLDAKLADGDYLDGLEITSDAVEQLLPGVATNAACASVLAKIPGTASGVIANIRLSYGSSEHYAFIYANGDGTVSIGWEGGIKHKTSEALGGWDLPHVWTMAQDASGGVILYRDGEKVLTDADLKFNNYKPAGSVTFGNTPNGKYPLAGMKVYAVHTDFGSSSAIFDTASDNAVRVFDTFDFMSGFSESTIAEKLVVFEYYVETGLIYDPSPVVTTDTVLHISEICPKPTARDPNGVEAGWVEIHNTSDTFAANLSDYSLTTANRGSAINGAAALPDVLVRPGEYKIVYTTKEYPKEGVNDGSTPFITNGIIVAQLKINPKKFPVVQLRKGKEVVDSFIVPVDLPDNSSFAPAGGVWGDYSGATVESVEETVESATEIEVSDSMMMVSSSVTKDATEGFYSFANVTNGKEGIMIDKSATELMAEKDMYSISLTFRVTNNTAQSESTGMPLFFCRNSNTSAPYSGILAYINKAPYGNIIIQIRDACKSNRDYQVDSDINWLDGEWHTLEVSCGQTGLSRIAVSVDGVKYVDTTCGVAATLNTNMPMCIGRAYDSSSWTAFTGDIKDINLYTGDAFPAPLPDPAEETSDKTEIVDATTVTRVILPTITPGNANNRAGEIAYGPNAGPLYGIKHKVSDWKAWAKAKVGENYSVTLALNPMDDDPTNAIQSVSLAYRTDFSSIGFVTMEKGECVENEGQLWTATIPGSAITQAGHILRWAAVATDAAGNKWRTPSFCDPDNAYEWYGTLIEPLDGLISEKLQTFHIFADTTAQANMDKQYDSIAGSMPYGARVQIYDSQTGFYYDNVRIDLRGNTTAGFRKKSHGIRFIKSQPLTCTNPFTGEVIDGLRKVSFIAEYSDPSFIRQALAFQLFKDMGLNVPYSYPVRLNMNGEFFQMAFHSNRFTDELIEDYYGLDPLGYAYKSVGTLRGATSAGGTEKKTPDDGNERDLSVLSAFYGTFSGADNISESFDGDGMDSEIPAVTKTVVKKFDLPAWLNYLAAARITQECDDVWANLCAYYDVNGTDTWMPLGYDFNVSLGAIYLDDRNYATYKYPIDKTMSNVDNFKSHPFYGGNRVRCHRYNSSTTINSGNRGFEAVWQSPKFRRLYLRRLRTVMDEQLKAPGTTKEDTPFWSDYVVAYTNAITADAALDRAKWGYGNGTTIYWWPNAMNLEEGIADLWDNYVVPRREHLFVTHSVNNTEKAIGYGKDFNAGIPNAQSPIADLKAGFSVVNTTDETKTAIDDAEKIVIRNANAEAVDMSGWRLTGRFVMTLPAGTVVDSNDTITVVVDRKTYVATHDAELTDQVIVGNAKLAADTTSFTLFDANGTEVVKVAQPSNESKFLRILAWDGIPVADDDNGTDEWVTLTNISDTVTLDLTGVNVKIGKDTTAPKCNITLTVGTLLPGGTITLRSSDFGLANGWEKITNGAIYLQLTDANGTIGLTSEAIAQKSFAGYEKGNVYLQVTSFGASFGQGDIIAVPYPVTTVEVVPGEDAALEATTPEEAEAALADCEIVLSDEDKKEGLVTNVLKLVAVPVVSVDPQTSIETTTYVARVEVDETKVPAPMLGQIEEGEATVDPLTVESDEEGSKVTVGVSNATVGLWYGFIWTDSLGDKPFENDVESFKRATSTSVKIESKAEAAKSAQKAFFRVKVSATKP